MTPRRQFTSEFKASGVLESAVEPQEQRRVRPRAPDDCVSADGVEDQRPSSRPLMRRTTRTAYGPRQRASRETERRVRRVPLQGVVRILCLKTILGRGGAGLRLPQGHWSARRLDVVVSLWEDVLPSTPHYECHARRASLSMPRADPNH